MSKYTKALENRLEELRKDDERIQDENYKLFDRYINEVSDNTKLKKKIVWLERDKIDLEKQLKCLVDSVGDTQFITHKGERYFVNSITYHKNKNELPHLEIEAVCIFEKG